MSELSGMSEEEMHKKFAASCFNLVWQLIEKKDRTAEDEDKMINAAHASRYHWSEIGKSENLERGDWQISRVYVLLGRPEPALFHARRCLEICEKNNIGDWDIAFAHEAMARAHSLDGNKAECQNYAALAKEAGDRIKEKDDRDLFFSELKTLTC